MSGPFDAWIGREERSVDIAAAAPVRRLAVTLGDDGADWPDDVLPPLGHWLFHLPDARREAMGLDGHPARGGFLPPIPQPRRMWAGSRVRFLSVITLGEELARTTRIESVTTKQGPNGELVFVTLRHEVHAEDQRAIVEEQDLVYLDIAPPGAPKPVTLPEAEFSRSGVTDPVLLFRFSALTFNAHRIHYDQPYAREGELYPELVVHGPLQAMLLLNHAAKRRPGASVAAFEFRARSPLYAGGEFTLCGAGADLWIRNDKGDVTMTARIELA